MDAQLGTEEHEEFEAIDRTFSAAELDRISTAVEMLANPPQGAFASFDELLSHAKEELSI